MAGIPISSLTNLIFDKPERSREDKFSIHVHIEYGKDIKSTIQILYNSFE